MLKFILIIFFIFNTFSLIYSQNISQSKTSRIGLNSNLNILTNQGLKLYGGTIDLGIKYDKPISKKNTLSFGLGVKYSYKQELLILVSNSFDANPIPIRNAYDYTKKYIGLNVPIYLKRFFKKKSKKYFILGFNTEVNHLLYKRAKYLKTTTINNFQYNGNTEIYKIIDPKDNLINSLIEYGIGVQKRSFDLEFIFRHGIIGDRESNFGIRVTKYFNKTDDNKVQNVYSR